MEVSLWRRKKKPHATADRRARDPGCGRVQALVKKLIAALIQECMDAEPESDLGYSKCDYRSKQTGNSRNGTYKKAVRSSHGEIELEVPRGGNGEYEPQIVKKHQMDISAIEDKIGSSDVLCVLW